MNQSDTSNIPDETLELESISHIIRARREKLQKLRELGVEPYPYEFSRTDSAGSILNNWESYNEESVVRLAGRMTSLRLMGKAAFVHLHDEDDRIQLYFKKDAIGEAAWEMFGNLDIGDIIGVEGYPFITRTGERSIHVNTLTLLSKNVRPLPAIKEKGDQVWYKWDDPEERYRHRSVDLIVNRDSRRTLLYRSKLVSRLRAFFESKGFVEVETPILQPLYGGAAARPFVTHHNTLDRDLYLRIADELYLKRLIAGGIPKVFEISKDFRNEGIDRLHSPEFTMLEAYAAWHNYTYCMELYEELLPTLAVELHGRESISWERTEINLSAPFRRLPMAEAIREKTGINIIGRDRNELAAEAHKAGVEVTKVMGAGKIIDELFSLHVQPDLMQPTFIIDHPLELSPLAKRHRSDPHLVERFELYLGGMEVVNAFSELNDPDDQRRRFEDQARLRAAGDEEATPIDEDFLEALEIGMPPTAGLGMGVDRLAMLFTDSRSIRDVILFPLLRPRD